MRQVHFLCIICTFGIAFLEGQSTNLAARWRHEPVTTNHGDEILFTCLRYNVLKNHVMDYAFLHLSVAAVLNWSDNFPSYEMIEICLCNILHTQPLLLRNEAFSYPSPCQTLCADFLALWEYAQIQRASLDVSRHVIVAMTNNPTNFLLGKVFPTIFPMILP